MSLGKGSTDTFKLLDRFAAVLGVSKTHFFPILESQDDSREDLVLHTYGDGVASQPVMTATGDATEPFYPYRHFGGVYSLMLNAGDSQYLLGADNANWSFGNGTTTDAAFSLGMWVLPDVVSNTTLFAKWDVENLAEDREWKLALDGTGKIEFSLYDDNANASEVGTGDTDVVTNIWNFVVVTYDGAQDAPDVNFYLNGASDGNPETIETGAYVAMQAGAENPTIGCDLDTNAPANEYTGRVALPFICGTELTAANVAALYGIGRTLLGS